MPRVLLDISPCEIILVEKDKYFMISLIYGFLKKKKKQENKIKQKQTDKYREHTNSDQREEAVGGG